MSRSRRYLDNFKKVDRSVEYSLAEAAELLGDFSASKFDESVEMSINFGVDPNHADQIVRGTVSLPNGTGRDVRVLVFA